MFKVSGLWVSPFEVECALTTHPAILEAAVVPEADRDGLTKPKAFVVLKTGAKRDGLDEALKEHVKGSRSAPGNIRAGSRSWTACPRRRPGGFRALQAAGWR